MLPIRCRKVHRGFVLPGDGEVTYEYKKNGEEDSAYTTTKPTDAGQYTVRATVAETDNYQSGTVIIDFTIQPKKVALNWDDT